MILFLGYMGRLYNKMKGIEQGIREKMIYIFVFTFTF